MTAEEEEEACGFFFLTFFLGFCVVASARAWIKWAGGWDWTLSLPSSPRTIQGMKSCWKAVLPRGEEGVGLGGANEMSNSIGSEERAQRRVRMGRKRGERESPLQVGGGNNLLVAEPLYVLTQSPAKSLISPPLDSVH